MSEYWVVGIWGCRNIGLSEYSDVTSRFNFVSTKYLAGGQTIHLNIYMSIYTCMYNDMRKGPEDLILFIC